MLQKNQIYTKSEIIKIMGKTNFKSAEIFEGGETRNEIIAKINRTNCRKISIIVIQS
jgi:hypothetical protein